MWKRHESDQYLLNCLAGVAFQQLSICDLICFCPWWRSLCFWATVKTGSHSCMSGPYVGHVLFFSLPHRPGVHYYSKQFDCTKLGQFAIKRQCCCQHCFLQEGDDEAVGIEWSHVVQKRIIKTKQWWHIWNLRTLPGRNEVHQSQAASGMNGSSLPAVPLWMRWAGHKMKILREFFFCLWS